MPLHEIVVRTPEPIGLKLGWVNHSALLDRVRVIEQASRPITDEQVLTYLCVYGYTIHEDGPRQLASLLLEDDRVNYTGQVWFEFLPSSPRAQEGKTHADLILGHVRGREKTDSGIEFARPDTGNSWVAIVEAKLLSDISSHVTYDPLRNQLLRVIENAVTFQNALQEMPNATHVVLLTPELFAQNPRTRFYGCKFQDYRPDPGVVNIEAIWEDLERVRLARTQARSDWRYPEDIRQRLAALHLHWVTFERLVRNMPDSSFKADLTDLLRREKSVVNP